MTTAKNSKYQQLIRGIVAVLIGVLIIAYPDLTIKMVIRVIGILLLIDGIVNFLIGQKAKKQKADTLLLVPRGIGSIIFGTLLLVFPSFVAEAFVFLIGIVLIFAGLSQVTIAIGTRKFGGFSIVYTVIAAIALISGVILLSKPFESAANLLIFFGVIVIIYGCGEIFWFFRTKHFIDQSEQIIDAEYEEVEECDKDQTGKELDM